MQGVLDLVQEDWAYEVWFSLTVFLTLFVSFRITQTQEDDGPVPDTTPTEALTDVSADELAPEREVNDFPPPQTAEPPQPTRQATPHPVASDTYEDPPWNEATLVMQDRSHHMNARCIAWQIWAEAVRLQRMLEELEDDSGHTL